MLGKLKVAGIFLFLTLFMNVSIADGIDRAIQATNTGNYKRALPILMELAHADNAVAQYNLALFYQRGLGVNQNEGEARRWFGSAARLGLVQAYNQLNGSVVKPGRAQLPGRKFGPQQWVVIQNPGNYTLQLASSRNQKLIKKYFSENNLQGKAGYYKSLREGQEWYALVYGSFPSVADANAHISRLPRELRKWSPWVRNIKDIHAIMLKENGG